MANIGDTNFSFKPQVDTAAIASLYQKKAAEEQSMRLQQEQIQGAQQDRVMNVMKMASDLTQGIIQHSAQQQMMAGRANLMDLLGQANNPVPNANEMVPAASSAVPQLSQAPTSIPQSQTPEFQNQMKAALLQANPQAATEELAKRQFAPPVPKYQTKNVLVNGTPTVLNFDPLNATYHDQMGNQVTGNIQPIVQNNPDITLDDKFRKEMTPTARAIIEGRQNITTATSMRGGNREKMSQLINELAPGFDASTNQQRVQLRKDFLSGGKTGQALQAFNTAIIHSEKLGQQIDALNASDFKRYNTVANIVKNESGKPEVKQLVSTRNLFADEVAKAARGGTGVITEEEVRRQLDAFDAASSPAQLKAVTDNMIKLMVDKTSVLKQSWSTTMGDIQSPTPFVTGKAAVILRRHGINPNTLDQIPVASQTGGTPLPGGFSYTVE